MFLIPTLSDFFGDSHCFLFFLFLFSTGEPTQLVDVGAAYFETIYRAALFCPQTLPPLIDDTLRLSALGNIYIDTYIYIDRYR